MTDNMKTSADSTENGAVLYLSPSKNARPVTAIVSSKKSKTTVFFKEAQQNRLKDLPIKAIRAPLIFQKSDGTMINLASQVEGDDDTDSLIEAKAADRMAEYKTYKKSSNWEQKDRHQQQPESPEREYTDILQLPQLIAFRGELPNTKNIAKKNVKVPSSNKKIKQVARASANSVSPSHRTKKIRKGRTLGGSENTSVKDILESLQAMPRPSTVPHKPLLLDRNKRSSNDHQNQGLWAPSAFSGLMMRPTTPVMASANVKKKATTTTTTTREQCNNNNNKDTPYYPALEKANRITNALEQQIGVVAFHFNKDEDIDLQSEPGPDLTLHQHEITLRPTALQYAVARGTKSLTEDIDVSKKVGDVLKQNEGLYMQRKHVAQSKVHRLTSELLDDIVAIRKTLPLSFLFEHNMSGFIVERGLDKIREVIDRIRMRAVTIAWKRWTIATEKMAEIAMEKKMLHLQAMHGRDRMLRFMKRILNSKIARFFEFWRDRCDAVILRERIGASEIIRVAWRSHRSRKVLSYRRERRRQVAAVPIQACWRGMYPRRKFKLLQQKRIIRLNVIILQSHWRSYLGRRLAVSARRERVDTLNRRRAAFIISSYYRGSQSREFVLRLRQKHAMATEIQRHIRGQWGRKLGTAKRRYVLEKALESLREVLLLADREVAATRIQELFRNYLVAREVMRIFDTIRDANANAIKIMEAVEAEVAAVGIQRAFVQSIAKSGVFSVLDEVVKFIEFRTISGSIRIQNMARYHRGRRLVRLWESRFVLETQLATSIQAWVRSVWGRRFARQKRKELTDLQILLSRRWRAREYARLRRKVMRRWAVGRRATLYKVIETWKHSAKTIKEHRAAVLWLHKQVKAYQCQQRAMCRWVIAEWKEWLALWLDLCRKRRKAYSMWRNMELIKKFKHMKEIVSERKEIRAELRIVFLQCVSLDTWNSFAQQPLVRRANLMRYRDIWQRWGIFTEWRKNLYQSAVDHHNFVFRTFYTRECWLGWRRYITHRHEHYALIAKGEAHCTRRRKWLFVKYMNEHRLRRRLYIRVLMVADKKAARKYQKSHLRAWQTRAAFQTIMKRNAKKALGYLRNSRLIKSYHTLACNAVQRRNARKVIKGLLYNFNRRESEMPFMTWKTNAAIMTEILQEWASTIIQKRARVVLAKKKYASIVRKKKYLFETAVKREMDVHVLEPANIDEFLRSHDMVVVHYYIPWDDIDESRDAFARAAAWNQQLTKKWLKRHLMNTPTLNKYAAWGEEEAPLKNKCIFAKANVAAMDSADYGRSLGVRMDVAITPTIRIYWRWGRGPKLLPAEKSKSFSFIPEDFQLDLNADKHPLLTPTWITDVDTSLFIKKNEGKPLQTTILNKLDQLLKIEIAAQIEIGRWSRGHIARAIKVPARKAEVYWEKQPLWIRRKNKRTGETEFYNRVSGELAQERPPEYVTPREEKNEKKTVLEMLNDGSEDEPTALQFKDSVMCMICEEDLSAWKCLDTCDVPMCDGCYNDSHKTGAYVGHKCAAVNVSAMHNNKRMCGECEVRTAELFCIQCLDTYCRDCYGDAHQTGRRQFHKYTLMTEKNAMRIPKDQRANIVSTKAQDIIKRREWKTLRIIEEEYAARMASEEARRKRLDEFRDVVKTAFDKYDADGSGTMEIDELEQMLEHELREPIPPEDLQAAIQEMDKDGNGVVDFEEFLDWFTSENARNRKTNLLLRAMRFKLRVKARTKNAIAATEASVKRAAKLAGKRIAAAKSKAKKHINEAAQRAAKARAKVYAKLPEKIRKAYEAPPRIPNTSVGPITLKDFDRLQHIFLRWTKEKFLLDIPYHGFLNKRKAQDAFEEVFLPNWNQGLLEIWHYHDGRRFEFEGETWEQKWDNEEGCFYYQDIDAETGEIFEDSQKLFYDPLYMKNCRDEAQMAFKQFDADGTGQLDSEEIATLLSSELCQPIRGATLKGFMEDIDSDGNGVVDFEEFLLWYVKETDVNGVNSKWARSLETKALKAAYKTKKATIIKAKEFAIKSKETFKKAKEAYEDLVASKELKHLTGDLRYPRDMAAKALAMRNNDVEKAVAWLKSNGVEKMAKIKKKRTKKEILMEKKRQEEEDERERLETEYDY
jgi:calmodulin